ncbi:hypothetical protein BJ138DRAFT_1146127 [Hygrophoropsis aurantiaca]|uniref:Uncharacterized protein n=1 Tax=Hygrophoropsis aurantiaca TaxID=72124 RepID=A0ACB8AK95_9AGAM|nr:hypothetical protein BJ138DRAFT_1146127 [Hygrophoropsis aurantiaca]
MFAHLTSTAIALCIPSLVASLASAARPPMIRDNMLPSVTTGTSPEPVDSPSTSLYSQASVQSSADEFTGDFTPQTTDVPDDSAPSASNALVTDNGDKDATSGYNHNDIWARQATAPNSIPGSASSQAIGQTSAAPAAPTSQPVVAQTSSIVPSGTSFLDQPLYRTWCEHYSYVRRRARRSCRWQFRPTSEISRKNEHYHIICENLAIHRGHTGMPN